MLIKVSLSRKCFERYIFLSLYQTWCDSSLTLCRKYRVDYFHDKKGVAKNLTTVKISSNKVVNLHMINRVREFQSVINLSGANPSLGSRHPAPTSPSHPYTLYTPSVARVHVRSDRSSGVGFTVEP